MKRDSAVANALLSNKYCSPNLQQSYLIERVEPHMPMIFPIKTTRPYLKIFQQPTSHLNSNYMKK